MLSQLSKIEVLIEGKVYQFLCASDAPLAHVKEALCQFIKFAGQVEDQAKEAQAKDAAEAAPQPEVSDEVQSDPVEEVAVQQEVSDAAPQG